MKMKTLAALALAVLLLAANLAAAQSLFPSVDELLGVSMPNLAFALEREADTVQKAQTGEIRIWQSFTDEDYQAAGRYFAGDGCKVTSSKTENGMLTVLLEKNGTNILFSYQRSAGQAMVMYPQGTRAETAAGEEGEETILPELRTAFGMALPSMRAVLGDGPGIETEEGEDGATTLRCHGVTEADYDAFSRYLAVCSCELDSVDVQGNVITAKLSRKGAQFEMRYDNAAGTAVFDYPSIAYIEDMEYSDDASQRGLLPLAEEAFGTYVPNIAQAIGRAADRSEQGDAGLVEYYDQFSPEDYAAYSAYLQSSGVSVVGYTTENGILKISLEKNGKQFEFHYNNGSNTAELRYGTETRPEAMITPVPTATPQPTPTPAPQRVAKYSQQECRSIAEQYFKNLSWKNPSSLTIHSIDSMYDSDGWVFIFDHSAQNSFGGMTRNRYYIKVDDATGNIVLAFEP